MQPMEATALGLMVLGTLTALFGSASSMGRRPRTALVLLWSGLATVGLACVLLVEMPY